MIRAAVAALSLCLVAGEALAQGTIRGVLHDSLLVKGPLEDATVVVEGTTLAARTDRRGRFTLRNVPVGTQRITFRHPRFDSLAVVTPVREVAVGEGVTLEMQLTTPSLEALAPSLCGTDRVVDGTGILFGTVRDAEEGALLPSAVASVRWFEVEIGGGRAMHTEQVASDSTGADGWFIICDVPNDVPVTLDVRHGTQSTGALHVALETAALARRDVLVSLSDTASRRAESTPGDTMATVRAPGTARLAVRVRNSQGRPLRNAIVGVRGTDHSATTGDSGVVHFRGVPAGSQTLVVRAIGMAPSFTIVPLRTGEESVVDVNSQRLAYELSTIAVYSTATTTALSDYNRRKRLGFGHFVEGRDLQLATSNMGFWYGFPGVEVRYEMGGSPQAAMPSMRGLLGRCTPSVWVDGWQVLRIDGWEFRGALLNAKRMEVYTSHSSVPAEFMTSDINQCGAIVIWTK